CSIVQICSIPSPPTFLPTAQLYLRSLSFSFNRSRAYQNYTLSLHDALPICTYFLIVQTFETTTAFSHRMTNEMVSVQLQFRNKGDRKSTRLNSSHASSSYAVFCLKKKNTTVDEKRLHDCCTKCEIYKKIQ